MEMKKEINDKIENRKEWFHGMKLKKKSTSNGEKQKRASVDKK